MSASDVAALLAAVAGGKKKSRGTGKGRSAAHLHSPAMKAKAKAGQRAANAAYASALSNLASAAVRQRAAAENAAARSLHGTARRKAGKALYGGSPLKDLLHLQRAVLSPGVFNKKRLDPRLAVQLFARSPGGIRSATRCAAAVEAARRASSTKYSPHLKRSRGNGVGLTPQRRRALNAAWLAKGRPDIAARFA